MDKDPRRGSEYGRYDYANERRTSQVNANFSMSDLHRVNMPDHISNFKSVVSADKTCAAFQLATPPISNVSTPVKEDSSMNFGHEINYYGLWLQSANVKVTTLCISWYMFSIISSNSSKIILSDFKHPVTLTQAQFILNFVFCVAFYLLISFKRNLAQHLPVGMTPNMQEVKSVVAFLSPKPSFILSIIPMGLFQFSGHILSHTAFSLVPVSTVHTVKALSPIITVLIYRLFFKVHYKRSTYISLIPLSLGIMLTCYKPHQGALYSNGLLLAFLSMLIFVTQNIYAKRKVTQEVPGFLPTSNKRHNNNPDKLTILLFCSIVGFVSTLPFYIVLEFRNDTLSLKSITPKLFALIILNGFSHFSQSLLAFHILGLVDPVSYSIANLMKRISVIFIAFLWESNHFSVHQSCGLMVTFCGLYCYHKWGSKHQ
ncbi:uncharacterized protein PRCAT00001044001 [Priceomyces carsonii]|uniref:uncharacterized protein n=1 Tax=Priceomyces carsonii TaxID=28549 RepID=UPI002ED9EFE8|nr:unnamed protein product [Priceomyces carsonii]